MRGFLFGFGVLAFATLALGLVFYAMSLERPPDTQPVVRVAVNVPPAASPALPGPVATWYARQNATPTPFPQDTPTAASTGTTYPICTGRNYGTVCAPVPTPTPPPPVPPCTTGTTLRGGSWVCVNDGKPAPTGRALPSGGPGK